MKFSNHFCNIGHFVNSVTRKSNSNSTTKKATAD